MFEGKKVRLRSIEMSDLEDIMKDWNNLKLRKFLMTPLPYSREEEEEWIRSTWERRKKGTGYLFAIEDKETKEFLGSGGLESVNNINRSAELGIAIHAERNWSKGYGTDSMEVLLKIGFDYLNFHRIQLRVHEYNARAIRVYEKVGFTQIGKLREAHFFNGEYHDVILMDILKEEWSKKKHQ
ncbi:MAG: GNAT family N-acetyltransferase [Candidatus Heimdallarchaeota archaeon]|nr:GNAT family N-acetyltransferase [Candidatus Heimdallarchaeota archaeon]